MTNSEWQKYYEEMRGRISYGPIQLIVAYDILLTRIRKLEAVVAAARLQVILSKQYSEPYSAWAEIENALKNLEEE